MPILGPEDVTVLKWIGASLSGAAGLGASARGLAKWLLSRDNAYQQRIEELHTARLDEALNSTKTIAELARGTSRLADENDELRAEVQRLKQEVEALRKELDMLRRVAK